MPLIHQIALGSTIPRFNRECLNSWHQLRSRDFEVLSWTDQSVNAFLAHCPVAEAKRLYRRARNHGEASDILRMAITYSYGGLYVDWDVLLVDPDGFVRVMPELESSNCVVIRDPYTTEPNFSCAYDNSLFYVRKGSPLALAFLSEMESNYAKQPVPNTPYLTGPLALTSFLDSHPEHRNACRTVDMRDVYAFDYEDVISQTHDDQAQREILRNHWKPGRAPAIHFWTHTWAPKPKWSKRVLDKAVRTFRAAAGVR